MRTISVSLGGLVSARLPILLSLWIVLVFFSASTIYLVGLEPMLYLHDAFHDVRHSTGFPCH